MYRTICFIQSFSRLSRTECNNENYCNYELHVVFYTILNIKYFFLFGLDNLSPAVPMTTQMRVNSMQKGSIMEGRKRSRLITGQTLRLMLSINFPKGMRTVKARKSVKM